MFSLILCAYVKLTVVAGSDLSVWLVGSVLARDLFTNDGW